MTDRELLEKAAKAAGIELAWFHDSPSIRWEKWWGPWNPLTNDGDALRLAVNLQMDVYCPKSEDDIAKANESYSEADIADLYAATRLAIVRAAAAIGEQME